ncbi:MAG: response regulator [Gammaproteobacteria bacterium]|nr:response regulator [Gammaproteobacteria bacterium]
MLQKRQEQLTPFKEVVKTLYGLCLGRHTGIFYLFTEKRHGATIGLSEGRIIDVAYLKFRGIEAARMLQRVSAAKYIFKQDLSLRDKQPNSSIYLPADNVILKKLGIDENHIKCAPSFMGEEIKKILLVDDSSLSRKVILSVFTHKSYDITEAQDGFEALSKIDKLVPDLVLLDVILPKMDGYQVLSTMKKNSALKEIPVIMLTSRDALMDKIKGRMSATDEYLTKPVNPVELMSKVEKYLR